VLLVEPFFWSEELWIHDPPGWHRNIQRGRTYDLREGEGAELWEMVRDRLERARAAGDLGLGRESDQLELPGGYGDPVLQPRRLGQGTFRALITDLYERRCAVTGEKALPALEAAHIQPYSKVREHSLRNGLLLRSDVHRLFDAGYVTVTPEYRMEASGTMREDFNDGENYLKLHGREVWTPEGEDVRPSPEFLRWHNERVFRG
jgi:putative restriction endonuclease